LSFATANQAAQDVARVTSSSLLMSSLSQGLGGMGSAIPALPTLSLVGSVPIGDSVAELSIAHVDIWVLPALGQSPRGLAVGVVLAGNMAAVSTPQNFLESADYASVITGRVAQAMTGFRWRHGDYPRSYLGNPVLTEYELDGKKIPVQAVPRWMQSSCMDANGVVVARMAAYPPTMPQPQEDLFVLGGRYAVETASVTHLDGTAPPADVAANISVDLPEQDFERPLRMSNVNVASGGPAAGTVGYLSALRAGVTRHLSIPFAAETNVQLAVRQVNGPENVMLSRGMLR
jgi:hypothetical protein